MRTSGMPIPLPLRCLRAALIIGPIAVLILCAATLPFSYESASIWYKTGLDRTLLRTGKVLAVIAACLLLLQIFWSARLTFLDKTFGLNNLYIIHRMLGLVILGLVLAHPVLVQLADDMLFIPFQLRYWPEFTGLFLAVLVTGLVLGSLWRPSLGIPYHWWRPLHQITGAAVMVLLFVHVLNVSETFQAGFPRQATYAAAGLTILFYITVKTRLWGTRRHPFVLTALEAAGEEAYGIRIKPQPQGNSRRHRPVPLDSLPGQFAFVSISSPNISREEHPFTIASSPTEPEGLQFIIRACGDWTSRVPDLRTGDQVFVDGPYGLFTHLRCTPDQDMIMIAGGIGITPMLSMLRYMADTQDHRRVTLVWSNKTKRHIIYPQEIQALQDRLPQLTIHHVLTAQPGGRRLDQGRLAELLSGCSHKAAVFVCGPPQMMHAVHVALRGLGFPRRQIFMERFSL